MNKSNKEFSNKDLLQTAKGDFDNAMSSQNIVEPRSPTGESVEPDQEIEYTETDLYNVNRILKCKNFYEILDVSKHASEDEIIQAYKKIALLIHPDKNNAPEATEAFKRLANALEILKDAEKRQLYDARISKAAEGKSFDDHARGFEPNLSAEQVFMMFFGALGSAAGGYAGYRLAGAISSNREPETIDREGNAVSPKVNNIKALFTLAGAATGVLAGIGLALLIMKPK